ncbi:hypothetical protein [Tautonia plasticadhaerens]|uniref:Uncharacterized protein n=1 Tax=Tautonia plasticadhaerens TaxID=2527974 RepID=A0A518HAP4_9BACT|nr:hypothetical protein [Tautonia plasticadhaerens]QDV37913.1 hypothetical protein ElP_58600 [Tautonia plasticadhaerens]
MILQVRQGETVFEVDVPRGCRVQRGSGGIPILIVPGPRPEDTSTWLPAPEILQAARLGLLGLSVRSEARPVSLG